MTVRKECLPDTANSCTHELTAVVTTRTRPVQAQARSSHSMEGMAGMKSHSHREATGNLYLLEEEESVLYVCKHW